MRIPSQRICIFGGTGFIGRYIVAELAKTGAQINVASRNASQAIYLKSFGEVGQITLTNANVTHEKTVHNLVYGCDTVINLIGILNEGKHSSFQELHHNAIARIARHSWESGVSTLIHFSALGVKRGINSEYIRSKERGEYELRQIFHGATTIRPSAVFGAEDQFSNKFACISKWMPIICLPMGGKTQIQPVYVGDIAKAVAKIVADSSLQGQIYELGGPRVITLRELVEIIQVVTGHKRMILPLPKWLSILMAGLTKLKPGAPLITRDQLLTLERNNIVSLENTRLKKFSDLGIEPTALEDIIPSYI